TAPASAMSPCAAIAGIIARPTHPVAPAITTLIAIGKLPCLHRLLLHSDTSRIAAFQARTAVPTKGEGRFGAAQRNRPRNRNCPLRGRRPVSGLLLPQEVVEAPE